MEYIVQPGDTLFAIAQRFGITLAQLLAANPQITNPALIFPGQRITIPVPGPPPTVYIVQPADTLSGIAARFGLTLAQLLAANPQITNPNLIFPGQRINIPAAPVPSPAATVYTVQAGDTLSAIAARFGTTVATLIRLNPGLPDPNLLFPGQPIVVPQSPAVIPPGCVVYISTLSGRAEVWRSDAAGRGALQLTRPPATPEQPVAGPRWSPDARHVAYLSGGALYITDPCGRDFLRLAESVGSFAWSNDGMRIAYSGLDGTNIIDLTGQVLANFRDLGNPAWFPGDQRLAGSTLVEGVRFAVLATVPVTGGPLEVIEPPVPAAFVRISPDGRYAATQLGQGSAFGIFSTVFIHDFQTGNTVQLLGFEIEVSPGVVRDLSYLGGWSPDSTRLVYTTLMEANGLGEVKVVTPEGAIAQRLTRGFYPLADWGPVADWAVLTRSVRPGTEILESTTPRSVSVLNIRTGQEIATANTGDNYDPSWIGAPCVVCL